jgi:ABC-type Fe3+/spermidine/putrescine transport system ATPase subunit
MAMLRAWGSRICRPLARDAFGGQRQRVAMARALVIEPQLLLLDEPLAALDVKLRVELRAMVRELQLEFGITTVFVTHDQEEALALSDVVAVMDRGRIVQIGAPRRSIANRQRATARTFLGSANCPWTEGRRRGRNPTGRGETSRSRRARRISGSVTGYRVRTDLGVLHVDVWGRDTRPGAREMT